jgi:phosphate:Na+ symporter
LDFVYAVLALAGAVALLLWGSHMVQSGVQRAFGPQLRIFLSQTLSDRYLAFLAGIGITLLLQSSTATALMATSFATGALVELVPALAIVAGGNVGTALIVQILAFDVVVVAPVLVLGGLLLFRRGPSAMLHDLGRVLIGIALMLFALHQMLQVIVPFEQSRELKELAGIVAHIPALALLLAAILAWIVHSSVAVVLLVVSLAAHGVVPLDSALVLVLGANLGTALNPLLEGERTADPATRRLPVGNLLNRVVGVLLAIAFTSPIADWLASTGLGVGQAVALFHLLFNLATAVIALPLLGVTARLLRRLLPTAPLPVDSRKPAYLDSAARETPVVALGGAAREALRLADALERMLIAARDALPRADRRLVASIRELDDVIDSLNGAINGYLTKLDPEALSEADRQRLNQVLAFSMNIEQAGDVVDRVFLAHSLKRIRRGIALAPTDEQEVVANMDRLIANLRTAASLLMTDDPRAARLLAREKEVFRKAERDATSRHLACLRSGERNAGRGTAIALDLTRDMKVINSFIVAAAAYPVLDRAGELLPNRLTSDEA